MKKNMSKSALKGLNKTTKKAKRFKFLTQNRVKTSKNRAKIRGVKINAQKIRGILWRCYKK